MHTHDPVARSSQEAAAMKSVEETVAEGYALHDDDHEEDEEKEKAAEAAQDNMSTPSVEFDNAYGHEGYQKEALQ